MKNDLSGVKDDVSNVRIELSDVKHDVTNLKQGQERIESKVGAVASKVDDLTSELRSNFKHTNEKLDEHRKVFEVVSGEIKGIKIDVDYLNSKMAKHDMELNRKKS